MKWFIKHINNIPIRQKFVWIIVVLIIVPMITIYSIFFIQIKGEVNKREDGVIDASLNKVITDTSYLLDSCSAIARDIALDQRINEILDKDFTSTQEYFIEYYDLLRMQLQMYNSSYNNVIGVSVYVDNPSILSGGNVYGLTEEIIEKPWFQVLQSSQNNQDIIVWTDSHHIFKDRFYNRVTITRKMDEFTEYDRDKYVRIDIEESKINNILQEYYSIDYVITDQTNRIITSSLKDTSFTSREIDYFNIEAYTKDNRVISKTVEVMEGYEWRFNAIVSKSSLSQQLNQKASFIIILFLISLTFSLLMILIFTNSYNVRIRLLQKHLKKVENREYIVINEDVGEDEIGGLIHSYNKMTIQVNDLVNQVLKLKIREKDHQLEQVKAELKFLQSQMDPHFLFNTLNALLVVSSRNGYEEITDIIKYLAKTLRYLIEWDDNMIQLEQELAFTRMYLEIEKFRFRDKFSYNIDVDETYKHVLIPKLIIQPFVENACKHGIQKSKRPGNLEIRVYEDTSYLCIEIKDNGIGMSEDTIKHIFEQQTDSHIGIHNVAKRLEIHFEDLHKLDITSIENQETVVRIRLPIALLEYFEGLGDQI